MKIWTSTQRAVEKRVDRYIKQLERDEERESLEHMALCGSILKENTAEISVYLAYKQGKSIPAEVSTPIDIDPSANI